MLLALYTIAVVVLLFGLTIFVHELGHFLVARWCGLVVDTFSIGFGPSLWKKEIKGVLYKIGCLPLGGYVALPQMDPTAGNPDAGRSDQPERRNLPAVAPWKKIAVSLAGVTGNMILAFALAWVVYKGGSSFAPEPNTIIGYVETNSAAFAAGVRIGDTIDAVNGRPVKDWDDYFVSVALGQKAELQLHRPDGTPYALALETEEFMGSRVLLDLSPMNYCYVIRVMPGSSADQAGIKAGDKIVAFNGVRLVSREHLIQLVGERRDQETATVVEREGQPITLTLMPRMDAKVGRTLIGVEFNNMDVRRPMAQIKGYASLIFRVLGALVTPAEAKAASQGIGGPVAILSGFWAAVQTSFIAALALTVMVNVNLAIINLLPLPVLDGGHIVFTLWELIFRRPVSPRIVNLAWNMFAGVLLFLFLMLTYRDVARLFPGSSRKGAAAATNAAPPAAETPAP
jgi:regulator of sigma E protease